MGKEGNLSNYQATGKDVSYRYDSYGLRTEKSVDGKVHRYIYQGGMLLREWRGDIQIEYLYDLEGITGLKYNNKAYYFVKVCKETWIGYTTRIGTWWRSISTTRGARTA